MSNRSGMFDQGTLKLLAAMLAIVFLAALPGLIWPAWLDSPLGTLVRLPLLLVYLLHAAGVPGLLQNAGACGWGWCSPSLLGWAVAALICLFALWCTAWVLARVWGRRQQH